MVVWIDNTKKYGEGREFWGVFWLFIGHIDHHDFDDIIFCIDPQMLGSRWVIDYHDQLNE